MTQVVTELVVRADGSLATLKQYEQGMQSAGRSTEQSTGAIDRYNAAMAKFEAAQRQGLAITTQRVERVSAEQRAMERWQSTVDKTLGLEIRLRRDAEKAAIASANAVALGYATQEEALRTLMALEKNHAQQLAQVRDASQGAVAANDNFANSARRLAAVNDTASFSTANLAAQFQDIAVTSAMGMNPLQIALQQGTQISAVFGGMGAAGAIRSLGAAFLSIVNPVSLVTIGLVAAGAAAIQYFMSTDDEVKETDAALKRHEEAIRALKQAYGDAAAGAEVYLGQTKEMARAMTIITQHELSKAYAQNMQELVDSGELVTRSTQAIAAEIDILKAKLAETVEMDAYLAIEKQMAELHKQLNDVSAGALTASDRFKPFKGEIDAFIETVRRGEPDIIALRQAISERIAVEPNNAALAALGAELFNLIDAGYKTQSAMEASTSSVKNLGSAAAANSSAVVGLAEAMRSLGEMIPEMAAAQRAISGVNDANAAYRQALAALNQDMRTGVITSEDVYLRKLEQIEAMHRRAIEAATGYTGIIDDLSRAERENALAGMSDREAAASRIRDTYAEQEKAIRALVDAGRSKAEVDALLARNSAALGDALANSARHFDEIEAKAGERGAAKSLRELERAARDLEREIQRVTSTADGLVEKWFPVEAARAQAEQLLGYLDQYGDKLTDLQKQALRLEAEELFRTLGQDSEKAADTVEKTLGAALADLFSKPMDDLDDFMNQLMAAFARIGQANIEQTFNNLFGGGSGGARGAAAAISGGGMLESIGNWIGGIFTSRKMTQAQNKAIETAAAKIPAEPLVKVTSKFGDAVSQTTGKVSSSMLSYAAAIRQIESGGDYSVRGPLIGKGMYAGQRAAGAYQVMPGNLPSWTKELLGYSVSTTEFLKNQSLQDRVFYQQFGKSIDKFGNFSDAAAVWFSGQPLSVSRARSDGFNNVEQYVSKANQALANVKTDVAIGAEVGIKEGITDVGTAALSSTAQGGIPGAQPAGGGGFQAGLNAFVGGIGTGFQTQDPAMGALSGLLGGLATGNPVMAIVGAIGGAIGGIFGAKEKKKQQKKQIDAAKQALAENQAAINEMFAMGEGRGFGDVTRSVWEFQDETHKLSDLARKAKDFDLIAKLQDNFNKFFLIVERDFMAVLPGMLDAYSEGFGSDSPFVQGKQQMEDLRQELKDFVADVQDFGDLQLKHNRALSPRELADRVAEAERAAQKMALATLGGTEQLSAMEEEMLRLDGLTSTLQQTLEELGMSARMAADAIDGALGVAVAKLRDTFRQDLNASINELSDLGYLNEIMDAQMLYQERLRDAAALGLDGSLALRELSLSIKDIVATAGLTKEEIALLSQSFPQLQFMMAGVTDQATTLAEAKSDLQAAYDKEAAALKDVISRTEAFIISIKQFRDAMKVNDSSPLGPAERVAEAAKQFREVAEKAATGDEEAMGQLTQVSQAYLDEARDYYASSEAYFKIWEEVDRTLGRTLDRSEDALSTAERQLKALDASVDGLITINDSVLSVKDALDQYNQVNGATMDALRVQLAAMAANGRDSINAAYQNSLGRAPEDAGMAFWQGQLNSGVSLDNVIAGIGSSREAEIVSAYRQILGINPTQSSVQALMKSGKTISAIEEGFRLQKYTMDLDPIYRNIFGRGVDAASAEYWRSTGKSFDQIEADLVYAKSQGSYASGGYTGDVPTTRIAGVTHGQEFVMNAGATRRYRAELEAMHRGSFQPSNDNGGVVAEIRALRADNVSLKDELRDLKAVVAQAAIKQIAATERVADIEADNASHLRKLTSK